MEIRIKESQVYKSFSKKNRALKDGWYPSWKKEILESISEYSKDDMKNLIKEYEIKLELLNNKKAISTFEFATSVLPSFGIFVTLIVTLSIKIYDNITVSNYSRLIDACFHILVGIMLVLLYAIFTTDLRCRRNSMKIVFYKEILEIFHDKLRNINVK